MDPDTVTTNTGGTQCTGTIRVYLQASPNTCVQMSSGDPTTSDNITFTFNPTGPLSSKSQYALLIKTGVEDPSGNNFSSDNVTTFTTP